MIKKINAFAVFILTIMVMIGCSTAKIRMVDIGPGWSRTSVNATIFRSNSIASHNGYQYVAYYDSLANVVLAKRKLGSETWEIRQTQYKGNALDAHNIISIMVDGDGFLHMAWDHHGHPLHYCKSVKPGSLEMEEAKSMTGRQEANVTYPEFYRMPSGDLIFAYRDGSSGNGNLTMNRYDLVSKKWIRLHDNLINGEGERNAYWQMHVSNAGVIHLSWVWREHFTVETNHDMCYARSNDGGKTWQNSNGKMYTIPIDSQTAEYAWHIPQKSDLINQTSMTSDDKDNPYIATYYQAASDSCPQYYIIYKKTGEWKASKATTRTLNFDLAGAGSRSIPISRPKLLLATKDGNQYLRMIYRDEEHQGRVCLASADLSTMLWKTTELTSFSVDRWEPSYDTELWRTKQQLNLYLQKVGQESGEKAVKMEPQMVRVLEIKALGIGH
jgi:hypothetical protein